MIDPKVAEVTDQSVTENTDQARVIWQEIRFPTNGLRKEQHARFFLRC